METKHNPPKQTKHRKGTLEMATMSVKYEISCPYHGNLESLELPDAYEQHGYEGEVRCGDVNNKQPLRIKIERHPAEASSRTPVIARLVYVERA